MKFFIAPRTIFSAMICLVALMAHPVLGAELLLGSGKPLTIGVGQQFQVDIRLSAEQGENLNAAEGTVRYSGKLLELEEIRDGNSIINLWIERPKAGMDGEVRFSGITPGGYQGSQGLVFSMIFRAEKMGEGIIEIREWQALQNDGKGTPAKVKTASFHFTVSQDGSAVQPVLKREKDVDPPEEFMPEIARDPNIFEGKWFVVFVTQDKGSGIDHYAVCEGDKKRCVNAESPYVLENQRMNQKIFVKAVDKDGNERLVELPPQRPLPWYRNSLILGILIGVLVASFILRKTLWKKYIKLR